GPLRAGGSAPPGPRGSTHAARRPTCPHRAGPATRLSTAPDRLPWAGQVSRYPRNNGYSTTAVQWTPSRTACALISLYGKPLAANLVRNTHHRREWRRTSIGLQALLQYA